MMNSDCRGCQKRNPRCHDSCGVYADFKRKVEAYRKAEKKAQMEYDYGMPLPKGGRK